VLAGSNKPQFNPPIVQSRLGRAQTGADWMPAKAAVRLVQRAVALVGVAKGAKPSLA